MISGPRVLKVDSFSDVPGYTELEIVVFGIRGLVWALGQIKANKRMKANNSSDFAFKKKEG